MQKVMMVKLNRRIFQLNMMTCSRNILLFGINLALKLGKNVIVNLSTIKAF